MVITSWDSAIEPDLAHPDSIIRLTSTILRFRCPEIGEGSKLNYARSFHTVGTHPTTAKVLKQAQSRREYLCRVASATGKGVDHKILTGAAQKYLPLVNQILMACQVQPENARLDEKLKFNWASGIEEKKSFFQSEAVMYELVMTIATEALGTAGMGCDACTEGDFAKASREFKRASGIFNYLATEKIPQWTENGCVQVDGLPAEASIGVCEAFHTYFLAIAQQMAIATVLLKPGTPNYSLLAKLSLGVTEQLEAFTSIMRSKGSDQKAKIDSGFFTLVTFQIELQRGLSMYFFARHAWDVHHDYGVAISQMSEAISIVQTRSFPAGKGLPSPKDYTPLLRLESDVKDMRSHMVLALETWEKDNSNIYFEKVPLTLDKEGVLTRGVHMMKPDEYKLEDMEIIAFILPVDSQPSSKKKLTPQKKISNKSKHKQSSHEDSDRELALQLQETLNNSTDHESSQDKCSFNSNNEIKSQEDSDREFALQLQDKQF